MTLFGKILLFLNLLLAGGFVYLATQDWKGRQTITASAVRHILLVSGFPVGESNDPQMPTGEDAEVPFKIEMAGGFRTTTVTPKLLDTYFANNAPGDTPLGKGTVASQVAEVKRVKGVIDQQLASAEGAAKVTLLEGWLLLQAQTYEEREAIHELVRAQNAAELEKMLSARFAAVIDAPKPADAEATTKLAAADPEDVEQLKAKSAAVSASRALAQDEGERRARIAHLLVHLNADPGWQKRVAVVVGLRRYAAAIAAQAECFRDMSARVEQIIPADQDIYLTDERTQLRLAIDRTELAARQARIKLSWQEQKKKEDDFVAARTTELESIKAQLRKVKAEVDELLVRQGNIEAALFEVQREVAITLDEVYQLEARLAARERDLLRLPPKPAKGN